MQYTVGGQDSARNRTHMLCMHEAEHPYSTFYATHAATFLTYFVYRPEAANLGGLMRLWVYPGGEQDFDGLAPGVKRTRGLKLFYSMQMAASRLIIQDCVLISFSCERRSVAGLSN